ncbi:Wzz/FepE/Etk N-terminal domain-containing protein [Paenibacillus sp. BK033]|uniref:YveK family protein n=1 Tax=unclassified Paenibacillus TaxID=185978 RepID=UPI001043C59E|nr:Wzz/FepE/Etk N-terminal domain-containing protein [Paenibacillus sp. BK033]NIK66655.1 capsular polysaccharide biosynthesis protein [Paenibacillus sp. BK720]TCN00634.1 capsular polysaccharide biosynthesis protein [Paenibacillus sp. BK033]
MEIKQYMRIVLKKWWLILILVLLASVISGVKSSFYTTPIYEATAKLIVNQSSGTYQQGYPDVGLLQSNLMLMDSYKEIISSAAILDKVVEKNPNLTDSSYEMSKILQVYSYENSQVLNLTYQATSYESAAETVNAISLVFKEEIPKIMNVDNITILNEAKVNDIRPHNPVNINLVTSILVAFVLSLLASVALVLILHFLDDTLKNEEELKEVLGIPLLAAMGKMKKEDMRGRRGEQVLIRKEAGGDNVYASINQ